MKTNSNKRIILVSVLSLLMAFCVALGVVFMKNTNKVKADTTPSLVILDGISIKLDTENDVGGMRFEAQMDTSTAQEILDETYKMYFVIAPTAGFDYYYNLGETFVDMAHDGNAIKISVNKDKIYPDDAENPTCYYAQACVTNISASNRKLSFEAGAYIVDADDTEETTIILNTERNATATGTFYDKTNLTIIGQDVDETAMGMTAYNEWYGNTSYPVMLTTQDHYNTFKNKCNAGNTTFADLSIGYTSDVTWNDSDFTNVETKPADVEVAHKVTFKNGEDTFETANVRDGSTATAPATKPTKSATETSSYDFYKWYNGDEEFDFSTTITSDTTLNAKYDATTEYANYCEDDYDLANNNLSASGSVNLPQSYYLAINLSEAVSNGSSAIAFATQTSHSSWVNVKFDMYVPTLASKNSSKWWGGFKFATSIGDNYSIDWGIAGAWTKGAWNTIEIKISGTSAQYWVNGSCKNTGTCPEGATYFYICLNPGDGTFDDTDILYLNNLVMQCDETTYTDTFANKSSTLLTAEYSKVSDFGYVNYLPNSYSLAINLKNATKSDKIAFATKVAHDSYTSITFDIYMPTLANKNSDWWCGVRFDDEVGGNYTIDPVAYFKTRWNRGAWNTFKVDLDSSGNPRYWINGSCLSTGSWGSGSNTGNYFYICCDPGEGSYNDTDIMLIDNLVIKCDSTTYTDTFDNKSSSLLTAEYSAVSDFEYQNSEATNFSTPSGKAISMDLAEVIQSYDGAIAFATSEAHLYKNISFDIYMPNIELKSGQDWIGHLVFKTTVGDNYSGFSYPSFNLSVLPKDQWSHIEIVVNGKKATLITPSGVTTIESMSTTDATYFFIAINPGNIGTTSYTLMLDNFVINDATTGTAIDDFNNGTATLITAEKNRTKKFNYITNTYCDGIDQLNVNLATIDSEHSAMLVSTLSYDNITSVKFDYTLNSFTCDWLGFAIKSSWTDVYSFSGYTMYGKDSWAQKAKIELGVTYSFVVTVNGTSISISYTPKAGGETKTYSIGSMTQTTGNYIVFFDSYGTGSYTVENFSMVADGKIYSGMQLFNYGSLSVTSKTLEDYSLSAIITAGTIETYLSSANFASIYANEMANDVVGTDGVIDYAMAGSKEFAIKVGMVDSDSAYIVVDEDSISVYVGSTLKKEITLSSVIEYSVSLDKTLTVNGESTGVTLTSLSTMKIVGFGGEGSVAFNTILINNHTIA